MMFYLQAVRVALDPKKPPAWLDERITFLTDRLRAIRAGSEKQRQGWSDMQQLTEFGTEYGVRRKANPRARRFLGWSTSDYRLQRP